MADSTVVFVVLDPTIMEQVALESGEAVAKAFKEHRGVDAVVHVYCAVNSAWVPPVLDDSRTEDQAATVARVSSWVERLVVQTRESGLEVRTEVEWRDDWRPAIVEAAHRQNAAIVVKSMTQHSRFVRLIRETADWTLIRECECPILLAKTGRPFRMQNLLVAVKHSPDDSTYEKANDDILNAARRMADDLGGNLHAVTCYDANTRPDRQRFADRCGLDRSQVSAGAGTPEKLIAEVASEQNIDLVIIARVARPDNPGAIGKTARKLIDELDTEVLVLPVSP